MNLLLYALNEDAPQHENARIWWEGAVNSGEPLGLAWAVILGFLRLSTRPGLFLRPLTCEQALVVVDRWLALPNVLPIHPGVRHWTVLRELLHRAGTAGNLTTDAHLAALAVEYGATLYSTDNDFVRFRPALLFVNPLAQASAG